MFPQGNYDVIEFYPPSQGMNQNISPDILPSDFAEVLENGIPLPLGKLTIRYGTRLIKALPKVDSNIVAGFSYITNDDKEQILLYAQEFVQDTTATNYTLVADSRYSFGFNSTNINNYVKDTPIKIQLTLNGTTILYDDITDINVVGNQVTITLLNNTLPLQTSGVVINQVSYAVGSIYCLDVESNTLSGPLKTGLSAGCVPRSETYLNNLIIYNGVDRILTWDGANLTEMSEFVKQIGLNSVVRVDDTHLKLVGPSNVLNSNNYFANNIIQITTGNTNANLTITSKTAFTVGEVTTINLTFGGTLPPITNNTQIFYQAFPPPFNFIKAINDRLWALAPGAVSLEYRNAGQEMLVYYSNIPGTLKGWFSERKQVVPSFDISPYHGVYDNLEAISYINGYMVFAGRERSQFWSGTDPAPSGESVITPLSSIPLQFSSSVNTGIPHGNLILSFPNDDSFITKNGYQSVSSYNIAKQFAATSLNAVDPIIKSYLKTINSSNIAYRACNSFKYDGGNLAGFKIGNNKVLASLFSTNLYSWTFLSGDFSRANAFVTSGNSLYLLIDNKIYQYADGNDGRPPLYGDQNDKSIVHARWVPAIPNLKKRRFGNKRYELQMDFPSTFFLKEENQAYITIRGDLPKSYEFTTKCRFDLRGDAFGTIPFTTDTYPTNTSIGFRFSQPFSYFKDRMKFLASKFSLEFNLYTRTGPIVISKIKLYGVLERR